LIASFQPSKVLILLAASCLLWIALLALGASYFFGATAGTAWIVASALSVSLVLGVGVMANEIRCAIDLPDSFDEESEWESAGAREKLIRKRSEKLMVPGDRQITRLRTRTPAFVGRSPQRLRFRKPTAIRRKTRPQRSKAR
jgi:hypothetical protein